ncbi:MAG: DUF4097 family beta strand repeat-containing protein [Treponema sp.]
MRHFFKNYFVFFFLLINLNVFALQGRTVSPKTCSIEAMLSGVDISISSYDGDAISYSADIRNGMKVSIVEDNNCLRFRNSHPVKGNIKVLVPKDMQLESCRVYATSGSVDLSDIKAIYFTSTMCEGNVNISRSVFKVASFSVASGNIKLEADITSTCDFCFSETKANLALKGGLSDFNFFYPYEIFSSCFIDGRNCTKDDKFLTDKRKKKRLGITQTSSNTTLNFVAR